MDVLGFKLRNEAVLETLTTDVVKSTEIEGQKKQIYNYPNFSWVAPYFGYEWKFDYEVWR